MKTRAFPAILIGLALSGSAWAGDPVDPAALGNLDAMLATCNEVNPGSKAAYDTMREVMIGEQPEGARAALASSPEYQQAFDAAREQAKVEPRDSAIKGCTQLASALGPHAHKAPKSVASPKNAKSAAGSKSTKSATSK